MNNEREERKEQKEFEAQIVARQDELWRESRDQKSRSIGHIALVSSGAIVVSVNALVPILKLHGKPSYSWVLIVAWGTLLSATVMTVAYRSAQAKYLDSRARYNDCLVPGGPNSKPLMDDMSRKLKTTDRWERATWDAFFTGLVLLLGFVALNLLSL